MKLCKTVLDLRESLERVFYERKTWQTGVTEYVCNLCGNSFNDPYKCLLHVLFEHEDNTKIPDINPVSLEE
jgi:hypothetical protein